MMALVPATPYSLHSGMASQTSSASESSNSGTIPSFMTWLVPGGRPVALGDWFGLHPLGEFVDGDQEVCHATAGLLERPDHVQPPDRKRLGEGDGLQCSRRQVRLMGELLTPLAATDDVGCVCLRADPEEAMVMSLDGD